MIHNTKHPKQTRLLSKTVWLAVQTWTLTWLTATGGVVTVVQCVDHTHSHTLFHMMDDWPHPQLGTQQKGFAALSYTTLKDFEKKTKEHNFQQSQNLPAIVIMIYNSIIFTLMNTEEAEKDTDSSVVAEL